MEKELPETKEENATLAHQPKKRLSKKTGVLLVAICGVFLAGVLVALYFDDIKHMTQGQEIQELATAPAEPAIGNKEDIQMVITGDEYEAILVAQTQTLKVEMSDLSQTPQENIKIIQELRSELDAVEVPDGYADLDSRYREMLNLFITSYRLQISASSLKEDDPTEALTMMNEATQLMYDAGDNMVLIVKAVY